MKLLVGCAASPVQAWRGQKLYLIDQKTLRTRALGVQTNGDGLQGLLQFLLMERWVVQLGREPLQRTNVKEIIQLLKAYKRDQAREEESHSRRQSQSSPRKARRSEDSSSTEFDDEEDDVSL